MQAWNDSARELWGLHSDEVIGQHVLNLDVGFPVDRLARAAARRCMSGAEPEAELVEAVNRRGRPVQVQVRFAPLVNGDQDPHGSIVMMEVLEQE